MGVTTCLGVGVDAAWERLAAGVPGIAPVRRFDPGDYPVQEGGEAPPPATGERSGDLSVEAEHLLGVVREALRGAGFEHGRLTEGRIEGGVRRGPQLDPARIGLAIGSSLAGSSAADGFFAGGQVGRGGAASGLLAEYYLENLLDALASRLGIEGPAVLISNACAAGGSSIAEAGRWLASGRVDLAVAAGYDPLSLFTFAGFGSLLALSTSRVRPFSRNRDGMLLGDGYAALVLEPLAAAARGAGARAPIGLLSGWGEATDAHHLTHPHPEGAGAALAMRRALERAGLEPGDIGYINCHGTATGPNDKAEVRAMRAVFGDHLARIPLSSSKPFFGHTLGGAGAVEAVVTLLALARGFLPATLHLDDVDPEFAGLDFLPAGRSAAARHAMSNSFGFGGANASLVFSRAEEEGAA
jgi:3-oxoacyl-[acyl-carrier-protein] synthase II